MTATSMNISLPENLKSYVKERVADGGYSTPSDFVRDLIRADMRRRGREKLEQMLLEGSTSGEPEEVAPKYRAALRTEAEAIIAGAQAGGVGKRPPPAENPGSPGSVQP